MRASGLPTTLPPAVVALVGGLASVALARLTQPAAVPWNEVAIALVIATYAMVAVVIRLAHPGHRVAGLMLLGACAWGVGEMALSLGLYGITSPGAVPAAELSAVLGTACRALGWLVLVLAVPLVFPDGVLPWEGRRWPAWVVVLAIGSFVAAAVLSPVPLERRLAGLDSPTGLPASLTVFTDLLALAGLSQCVLSLCVALAGLVHRWRTGDELRRQQLLWLCVAFALPVLFLPLLPTEIVRPWMFALVTLPVPVAIGVAMVQRRLYDVQFAVSRALTYLLLSAAVAALYALTVGGVGALLRERGASWLPWVAAGVVAVSFAPLRDALQQGVNRLTYGQWSEPAKVLAATGRRLADASDIAGLLGALTGELARGLGMHRVEIRDVTGRALAAYGSPSTTPGHTVPLTAFGAHVGEILWAGRPLRGTQEALLADLANQLGGVVHAVSLIETIREGQHRLVLAREEERRRLRRDIHDGLGPALASLTLQVDTIRNQIGVEGIDLDAQLVDLRSAIRAAVTDVRRIVEGLRPPALDELGLTGALEQLVSRTLGPRTVVHLDIEPLPHLPAAVEVAVLRVSQEALTNVVQHAHASNATVQVLHGRGMLRVLIRDDGDGGAKPRVGGVGLGSMSERATELGGTLDVHSVPGRGTTVHLHLPLAVEPTPQRASQ